MESIMMTIDRDAKNYLRDNAVVIEKLKNDSRFVQIGNSVFKLADHVPADDIVSVVGGVLVECVTETVTVAIDFADGSSIYRIGPINISL